ncbi:uncharacterized protein BX663DRAFT_552325 [Cokeromyces recurvatus]|uniref:uncharacterized protein n=1 Tax=Cokeromyces recurvatus TaxID=90255 RepID=UPI00221F940F|nr:uncharacterized protein BX663DRAFT_552325 [Cokeromyces recurvatus]KAI7902402.1 hypothetical protein BX663DRAFT_552325 [Cokeromyces recurvatus]
MTTCGICPASRCMNRELLGLPPLPSTTTDANSTNVHNSSTENNTGTLVGGIIGGLVGIGIILGIIIYGYLQRSKKQSSRGKLLPFLAFSENNKKSQQQEQSITPHPAVIAALSHQRISVTNPLPNTKIKSIVLSNSTANGTHMTTTLNSNIPEEFESRIAFQNKRISEILSNNPRLSQLNSTTTTTTTTNTNNNNRNSIATTNENRNSSTFSVSTVDSSLHCQSIRENTPSVQVIQVTRAKPQIMRVNSVRTISETNNNGLLSRSASVRTILTVANNLSIPLEQVESKQQDINDTSDNEDIQKFPSTPNNRSFATTITEENPFHDEHSTSSLDATNSYWNNKK